MFRSAKKFMPTYILVALNIAVYVYTSAIGGNFMRTGSDIILQYGQVNALIFDGWYWQLFTALFIHVNILHILGNMFFLFVFGLRAEELFSIKEYLFIYFLSGFAGNLLTLLYGPDMISAGASGAIFGLFGACTIYFRRAIGQSLITALLYAFFLLMISSGPEVNFFAHLGGLLTGLVIGYLLTITRKAKAKATYQFSYTFTTK